MKKILTVLLVLSIGTIALMGCSLIFGTTYSVTSDGYCYEVKTSNIYTIGALDFLGAVEEPCDTTDVAASCTFISDEYNQEMTNYYSAEYLASVEDGAEGLKADCLADDGEWETF